MGASSLSSLLSQRHWMPEVVDARMALPRSLWKATALVVYGIVVAAILLPWLYLAWILKVEVITQLIMGVLLLLTHGLVSLNLLYGLCRYALSAFVPPSVIPNLHKNSWRGQAIKQICE
jgi:hypothetical protein